MSQALEPEGGVRLCARKVQTVSVFFEMPLFPLSLIITPVSVEMVITLFREFGDLCVCVWIKVSVLCKRVVFLDKVMLLMSIFVLLSVQKIK